VEADAVNPLTVSAETKVMAEKVVLTNSRHTVIRTSLNYGTSHTGDRAFNEEMVSVWQAGRTLTLFTDEFRCPIPAEITARAVWTLISQNEPGLYHLAGGVRLSRWQIGELIASRYPHVHPRIEPGSLRDYQGPARSPDTSLNCARIQALLPFPLPGLIEWLAEHPTELR
jgi:dTDP-4-dehydrorhamnose reductase